MGLVVTPRGELDESYGGYLLRVANANGFSGLRRMAYSLRLGSDYEHIAYLPRDELLSRLGIPLERAPEPRIAFCGEARPRCRQTALLGWTAEMAWCPTCLKERGYWRASWDSPLMLACIKHGVRLLRRCHACGRRATGRRGELLFCNCGHDYRDCRTESAGDEEMRFCRQLADDDSQQSQLVAELRTMTPINQLICLRLLMSHVLRISDPAVSYRKADVHALLSALARAKEGREFLRDPDSAFGAGLRRALAEGRFTALRQAMLEQSATPPFVIERIEHFSQGSSGWAPRGDDGLVKRDVVDRVAIRGFATARDLRQLFGGPKRLWTEACAAGLIRDAKQSDWLGNRVWNVSTASVAELAELFRWSLSRHEVAARLRITPAQVVALAELGVLQPIFSRRAFVQASSIFCRYLISAADDLVDLLEAMAWDVQRDSPKGLVSLAELRADRTPRAASRRWTRLIASVLSAETPIFQIHPMKEFGFRAFALSGQGLAGVRRCIARPAASDYVGSTRSGPSHHSRQTGASNE